MTAHHVISSRILDSILMPLTARMALAFAPQTNPQTQRLKGGVHRCMGQGLPICEEDDPRLHISRRLYARRGAPVHSQSTANHHPPKAIHPALRRHPSNHTSPRADSGSRRPQSAVWRYRPLHLTPHHADRPGFSHDCRGPPPSN